MANEVENETVRLLEENPPRGLWQPTAGPTTQRLRDILLPHPHAADPVILEARNVLAQCTPPTAADSERIGLVCGYVQSGKTASMTAVSALAKDNCYRIVILLAGVTTILVDQNRARLESDLRASSSDWAWMMLSNPKVARNQEDIAALAEEWHSPHYEEEDRRTLFVSVMKNPSHLRNLAALLRNVDLTGVPAIIFDDEADQSSLNTRPTAQNPSTIYQTIAGLRGTLPHHTYLQYTATPQAPLLITRIDSLSADFAELVSPGEGYTGGQVFFMPPMNHVENIPRADVFRDGALPVEPPDSLLRALSLFFIGVAAGRCGEMTTHRSMLVHPSVATTMHRQYYDWTNAIKANWHALLVDGSDADRAELLHYFRQAYDDIGQTCEDLPEFEQAIRKLPVAINQTAVTLVNSRDGREVPWRNGYSHILVGGEKLGRGYTVKGLTVTYMPRPPGGWTADTIQQRARFFGYHIDYLGYCRVFLHPDVCDAYVAYVTHEEDMRARLDENRGLRLIEWRRMFYLDRRLAPTRRNVLSSPYMRPRLQDGWFSPSAPHEAPRESVENVQLVRRLENLDLADDQDHPQHRWAVAFLAEVFEDFLVPLSYLEDGDALGLCVANCNLRTLIDQNDEKRCLIYFMDHGRNRLRTLTRGRIPQLFQGRSSAGAQSYPGDRAFCDQQIPTIQIHMVTVAKDDDVVQEGVPAVAIKIPNWQDVVIHDD